MEAVATTNFEFFLYALRCVGLCPLVKTRKGRYEFRWSSAGVMWNITIALIDCFVQLIYAMHVIFKQFLGPSMRPYKITMCN